MQLWYGKISICWHPNVCLMLLVTEQAQFDTLLKEQDEWHEILSIINRCSLLKSTHFLKASSLCWSWKTRKSSNSKFYYLFFYCFTLQWSFIIHCAVALKRLRVLRLCLNSLEEIGTAWPTCRLGWIYLTRLFFIFLYCCITMFNMLLALSPDTEEDGRKAFCLIKIPFFKKHKVALCR